MATTKYVSLCCSRLIVCEKSGDWAKSLRRVLTDCGRWIVETRGFNQLAAAIADHPASLCVVEVKQDNIDRAMTTIDQLHHHHPHCGFVAACGSSLSPIEMTLREAGAVYVVQSRRDVDVIQRLWEKHCQRHPPREETIREQIVATLPWS